MILYNKRWKLYANGSLFLRSNGRFGGYELIQFSFTHVKTVIHKSVIMFQLFYLPYMPSVLQRSFQCHD